MTRRRTSGYLEPGRLPYSDRDTSLQAAKDARSGAGAMRTAVLAFIRSRGRMGATDDEIEAVLGYSHQTASARRRELVIADLIRPDGTRRPTRSGSPAQVWVAIVEPPTRARPGAAPVRRRAAKEAEAIPERCPRCRANGPKSVGETPSGLRPWRCASCRAIGYGERVVGDPTSTVRGAVDGAVRADRVRGPGVPARFPIRPGADGPRARWIDLD